MRLAGLMFLSGSLCAAAVAHAGVREWSTQGLSIRVSPTCSEQTACSTVSVTINNVQSGALEIVRGEYQRGADLVRLNLRSVKEPVYRFTSPLMGESLLTGDGRLIQIKEGHSGSVLAGSWNMKASAY